VQQLQFPLRQPLPGLARGAGRVHSKRSRWQVSLSGQILAAGLDGTMLMSLPTSATFEQDQ
jgi:hypothetical protein